MKKNLKALFKEYNSLTKLPLRMSLGKKIKAEERKIIEDKDYVELINVLRFLGDCDKNRLFIDLLVVHPETSLFVLAFADSTMRSYTFAYQLARVEYDGDEEGIRKDVELVFDDQLCAFLGKHKAMDDLEYVYELVKGATWLENYK